MERTPQGGARIPASFTRVGVLDYRLADGSVRRELRPADEVFREDSLATLRSAPVTIGHVAMVTSDNWSNLSVGHIDGSVRKDGDLVSGALVVQAKPALERVDASELQDVSSGYTVDYDPTPGEYQGQRYDGVQRNIRYNHVALMPVGGGRAGRDVGLRLDSASAVCDASFQTSAPGKTLETIRIDSVEYKLGSQELADKLAEMRGFQKRAETESARADGLVSDLAKSVAKVAELADPKRFDAAVQAEVELRTKAASVLGTAYKFDGKSTRDFMIDCVKVDAKDFTGEGKTDEYVRARFDGVCEKGVRADSIGQLPAKIADLRSERTDSTEPDAEKARAAMILRNATAWQTPAKA